MGGFTRQNSRRRVSGGFTLVEVLVATFIFLIIATGIYQGFTSVLGVIRVAKLKTIGVLLANEQIELLHNLAYADVGVSGAIPNGAIPFSKDFSRGGHTFTVETVIRNIDDPFDGLIGEVPNDLAPADYKLAAIEISCSTCISFPPLSFTTTIAPKHLEITSGNGALFVEALDANGLPVQGAQVVVSNPSALPPIAINDVTNVNGILQLVDVPPGVEAYEISVGKSGYSEAETHAIGEPGNPNPIKPHATVALGMVTEVSFAIDRISTLFITTQTNTCAPVGSIGLNLRGSKLIGASPDVYKYEEDHMTNGSGNYTNPALEWDDYLLRMTSASYDISGTAPLLTFSVTPASTQDVLLIMEPNNPDALLVSVKDAGTGLPVSDATVTLSATSTSYNETLVTSRGHLRQTDWSGGGGQSDFIDETRYLSSDGNIDINSPVGEIKLVKIFDNYVAGGELISSSFNTGATTTTFYEINWEPGAQPPDTGALSVRFQIATNNDNTTWNFKGPDGTNGTYYTFADKNIHSSESNHQYIRYKALLGTASTTYTPSISDVAVTFGSSCIPFGQAFFNGLSADVYTLTVSHSSYQSFTGDITISDDWSQFEVLLQPI